MLALWFLFFVNVFPNRSSNERNFLSRTSNQKNENAKTIELDLKVSALCSDDWKLGGSLSPGVLFPFCMHD